MPNEQKKKQKKSHISILFTRPQDPILSLVLHESEF